jgi:protein-tyrosine phosphatase
VIDLHFHCLPGIDDGPENWAAAVALCRAAAADGTETLVATPHVLRGDWLNEDAAARDGLILRLNTLLGGRPAILPGCEYLLSDEAVALFERDGEGPLTGLNRGRYLLVELPAIVTPRTVESTFHELSLLGAVPVVAHPERHSLFRREPEFLARLVRGGAVAQITAASLLGHFGERAQAAAEDFFQRGLVSLVASDAHSLERRPPVLSLARERVRRRWGSEAEEGLFVSNPTALIRSEPLPGAPAAPPVAARGSRQ